jgi:uncharacterized membrane protein
MTFEDWMEHVVRGFEISGAAVLVAGSLTALLRYLRGAVRGEGDYQQARTDIGRAILMGLEVLIIADIVQTITVDTTVESAVTLGLVVLVRTFLSFSLEVELDGVVPWRKTKASTPPSAPAPAPGDVT